MSNIFFISDLHFGHANIISFCNRPFTSVDEMNETLINNWNKVVGGNDTVWVLGDICMSDKYLHLIDECKGRKNLVLGNHDLKDIEDYRVHFHKIRATTQMGRYLLTHYPVHQREFEFLTKYNLHGHIHNKLIDDPRYFNCSVEQIDYTPIPFESIRKVMEI